MLILVPRRSIFTRTITKNIAIKLSKQRSQAPPSVRSTYNHFHHHFLESSIKKVHKLPKITLNMDNPSASSKRCIKDIRPLVISGPSGVGKGTLCNLLLTRYPSVFATTISHTTRTPRVGELDGREYYFISNEEFERLIQHGAFVEHAQFSGNRYGTSKNTINQILNENRVPVLDIEMEGVKQIKESQIAARYIFIAPPSLDILEQRLRGRGTEKEESIQKRLAQAQNEIAYAATEGAHDIIIVNDNLEQAYAHLEKFIFED